MMNLKNAMILGLILTHGVAMAGERGGNGGDAVICPDGVVMLDYIEMKKRQFTLDLPGETLQEKVDAVISKVRKVDAYRANFLKEFSSELILDIQRKEEGDANFKNVDFTQDILLDIPDSLETTLPKGCTKEQLVTQKTTVFPGDKRYTIAENIFDQMNTDQVALMVLHESWYRLFLSEGAKDSRFTRYINGVFASREKSQMSLTEYLKYLRLSPQVGSGPAEFYTRINDVLYVLNYYSTEDDGTLVFRGKKYINLTDNLTFEGVKIRADLRDFRFDAFGNFLSLSGRGSIDASSIRIKNLSLEGVDDARSINFTINHKGEFSSVDKILCKSIYDDQHLVKKANILKPFLIVSLKVKDGKASYVFE